MISRLHIQSTEVLISKSLDDFEKEIHSAFQNYTRVFLLMDVNTHVHCFPEFQKVFPANIKIEKIVIPAGEKSKSITQAEQIWKQLFDSNATKNDCLIALGGGVVSDLGGFVAALYKRGMNYFIFPTSLMAMTDAALGGKTGIDFLQIKNSIGVLYSPEKIIIATSFLKTLNKREYKNGLAEVYKHAIVADDSLWNDLKSNENEHEILLKSIAVKEKIVNNDFHEKGERKILNFGHTIGHALEGYALENNIDLLHGEAIISGMKIESILANKMGLLSEGDLHEIILVLNTKFPDSSNSHIKYHKIEKYLKHDKKNSKSINFSLPTAIGQCSYDCFAGSEIVSSSYSSLIQLLCWF
jgi:3-dehydroquinate synthase